MINIAEKDIASWPKLIEEQKNEKNNLLLLSCL